MKVAVSTEGSLVSAHFGRCLSYTIFEIQDGKIISRDEIPNPGHQPGFLPSYLAEKGVGCIIAGGMGPRAQALFVQSSIETIIGVQGTVDDVIQKYLARQLESGEGLCDHGRHTHQPCEDHASEAKVRTAQGKKICITSQGKDAEAEVDPRFGRASFFMIFDPDSQTFEAVENPNTQAAHGAGIQTAQMVVNKDVGTVLTGDCGPKAMNILQASGVKVVTGVTGKIKDALKILIDEAL